MSGNDDIFNMMGKRPTIFSLEEIEAAAKQKKKTGANILDALTQMTGKTITPVSTSGSAGFPTLDLEALNREIRKDFDLEPGAPEAASAAVQAPPEPDSKTTAEKFSAAKLAAAQKVFGQEALLKALAVAFRRPMVLPEEPGHARNVIYLTGPDDTGRHSALSALVSGLREQGVLTSDRIHTIDLSAYGSAEAENIFLQDLYAAIAGEANVILFENFTDCHSVCVPYLSDLAIQGSCRLAGRYFMQKGQLVNISNSFMSDAVGSFSAAGKYLVFLGTKDISKLADVFGAPMVNAVGDICRSSPLNDEAYRAIAALRWQELCAAAQTRLSFRLQAEEEMILSQAVAHTGRNAGVAGLNAFFQNLLKALAAIRLEQDVPQDAQVVLTAGDGSLLAEVGEETIRLADLVPTGYTGEIDAVKKELENIVGLANVKEYIYGLEKFHAAQKQRREAGLKTSEVSRHMVFTGNPGTGKTTIARIVSRYLKAIGVLSGGQLVEVSRADLVGRYVGHTAPLTNQVIRSALGGVLFIDEAYSLYRGKDDSFGLEAIDTLVKGMEDHRDDLIVILAGYTKEMHTFLEANSGLKSRFPNWIDFPDYTPEELLKIGRINAASRGYVIDSEADEPLLAYFADVQSRDPARAGNGRLVRNKLEEAILNQSRRLSVDTDGDLSLLLAGDFDLTDAGKQGG